MAKRAIKARRVRQDPRNERVVVLFSEEEYISHLLLTGVFGLDGVSGVGISFGADRIFDVLNQLELYPKETTTGTRLMFVNFGEEEVRYILPILGALRAKGISVELYPEAAKLKKQMTYANALAIPYVAFVGEAEVAQRTITIKDMAQGNQSTLTLEQLIEQLCE